MKVKLIDFGYEHKPNRAHRNDAGADVYATEDYTLQPHETYAMGLGFGIETPVEMAGFIMPRSSMSAKGIVPQLTPVDAGYEGEIHAVLTNYGTEPYEIKKGDRVAQLVLFDIATPDFVEKDDEDKRGEGAFGSTGR